MFSQTITNDKSDIFINIYVTRIQFSNYVILIIIIIRRKAKFMKRERTENKNSFSNC